jgi:hypothetical protein
MAAKGGGGGKPPGGSTTGSYTVTIDQPGPYSLGQQVTVSTTVPQNVGGSSTWLSLTCMQGGQVVGAEDHANFPEGWYYQSPFTVGPSGMWTTGDASCTMRVYHFAGKRSVDDATTRFVFHG